MLSQIEADTLIAMLKMFQKSGPTSILSGADETHELFSSDGREAFLLDLARGSIRLSKVKCQTRGRKIVILVRVCIDGMPHTNPDGQKLGPTHIHLYREGFEARWAFPLDPSKFSNPNDVSKTLADFCAYCNIREKAASASKH